MTSNPQPAKQPEGTPAPQSRSGGPIRVSMPASIAYDLPSFQDGIASVLKYLGCPACCSGYDITFGTEREFMLNEKLELRAAGSIRMLPQDPVPDKYPATVTVPQSVSYNLDQIREVAARVAGRLGCNACCSGFDLRFRQELDFVVDPHLNVRAAGEGF
jgi:hypothetical protein